MADPDTVAAINAAIAAATANMDAEIDQQVQQAVALALANMPAPVPPVQPPVQGGAPQGAAPPPPPIAFSRTPAQATIGLINLSTPTGMKVYNAAITGLSTKFTFASSELYMFLKNGEAHARDSAWNDIFMVPNQLPNPPPQNAVITNQNLFQKYGLIPIEDIKAHATIYEALDGRAAQNSSQMFTWIMNSLTDDAKAKVMVDVDDYTIKLANGTTVPNGPLCLKVLIRNCTIDTRSTNFHLRTSLTSQHLQTYLASVSYDIELLNQHVKTCTSELLARGKTSSDLLVNLFATYLSVPDKPFVDYITAQKDKYDEGIDMDYVKLMYLALTKFKDRIRSKLWQAPSVEQEQIIALTAQIESLRKKKKTPDESYKKPKKKHDYDDEKFAWKKVPPKDGEPKTKIVNGKTYYHGCPHNIWTIHKPEDCRMTPGEGKPSKKKKDTISGAKLEMNRAMQALIDTDDLEDDDEESDEE